MAKFKKCPRCDVNYIATEKEYCDICLQEMRGVVFTDIDDEEDEAELCPRCRVNYLNEGEKVCESCALEADKRKAKLEEETDWEAEEVVDEIDDEDLVVPDEVSLEGLAESEADESWDDEDETESGADPEFEDIGDLEDIDIGDDEDDEDSDDEDEGDDK